MRQLHPYLKTKDFLITQEEFSLLLDPEKHMLITHPKPKNLEDYYKSDAYISHTDQSKGFISSVYQIVKKFSLYQKYQLIKKLTPSEFQVLDIGAGTGDFLRYVKEKQWSIFGVEPNEKARSLAIKKGVALVPSLNDLPNRKYPIITLWHVLEHMDQLEETIHQFTNKLEPNGYLIIAVPNYKSFDAKYYKKYWAAYDTPRHLWHFSKKSIQSLFNATSCELIATKPMYFDSFYVALLSEKYKNGKTNYLRAFCIGLLSNLKGYANKEYSSHIYILQKSKNSI